MKKILALLLIAMCMSACTTTKPLQAPCDNGGVHCWPRTKINQWGN